MDFVVNPWGATMASILLLAPDLVGAPLHPALVGDVWIGVKLPSLDFLARPA